MALKFSYVMGLKCALESRDGGYINITSLSSALCTAKHGHGLTDTKYIIV